MNVSFGWTWPAFVAVEKICTRRGWKDSYALRFKKGSIHTAIDKDYRYGGKKIGVFKMTDEPVKESTLVMPDSDYKKEGFLYMRRHSKLIPPSSPFDFGPLCFDHWREKEEMLWVVRYEIVEIFKDARARLEKLKEKHGYQ